MNEPGKAYQRPNRQLEAEELLANLFAEAGWVVQRPARAAGLPGPDLIVRRGDWSYAVEVKAAAEGRSDRLIPLWSQAVLQAARMAGQRQSHLAVIAAPRIPLAAAQKVLEFAASYAPAAAVGVVDFEGLRLFRGQHLERLNWEDLDSPRPSRSLRGDATDLFSDLNQWMLKLLLAPEISENLLSGPRERYQNASQLARAAQVSVMSASRFLQQLKRDAYLDESSRHLRLVRREDLFRRWQAAAARKVNELPMRLLLGGNVEMELSRMLHDTRDCLALFAAADALQLGFVEGVPPHVYVPRLNSRYLTAWKNLVPAADGEAPHVFLRQAPAPESIFRGAVVRDDLLVSDVVQIWLDVWSHPSRGREQADLIQRGALSTVIDEQARGG